MTTKERWLDMRAVSTLAAAILLIACSAPTVWGRTWRVERDGSGDFTTIQPAVDASAAGDTIRIGAGRYAEMASFSFPGLTVQTVVGIQRGPLTFLGSGQGDVILGPAQPDAGGGDVEGISIQTGSSGIHVEGLTVEHLQDGILAAGSFVARNCTFRNHRRGGVTTELVSSARVESCTLSNSFDGVLDFRSSEVQVQDCTVADNVEGINLVGTRSAEVARCRMVRGGVGVEFEQGTVGEITACVFENVDSGCLSIAIGSRAVVTNNRVCGTSQFGTWVRSTSDIIATGNVLEGGTIATVHVDGGSTASFSGNDIRRNGTWSVLLAGYFTDPPKVFNFQDNYWGTSSASEIASWIYDGNDDPALKAFVEYEPFRGGSIPAKQQSFGSLKAGFRDQDDR